MGNKCPGFYYEMGKKARDLLYKDYTQQPPIHYRYQFFDWSFDFSFQLEDLVPGLNTVFRFIIPDPSSSKVEMRYLHDYAGITAGIGLMANPIVNFSSVIGCSFLSLGTDISFDTATRNFIKYNAGLSFTSAFLIASLTLNDKVDTLNASCYHIVNSLTNTAIAAELTHNFSRNENSFTIGTQHALCPVTLVKARVNTYGTAGALIQHELRPKFFVTVAGEVDTWAIKTSTKVGLSLALRP